MLKLPVTPELMKEVMVVLHAAGHAVLRDLARRFQAVGVVADLHVIYDVMYEKKRTPEPVDSLARVAAHFHADVSAFTAAWRHLQLRKEALIEVILKAPVDGKLKKARENISNNVLWTRVLSDLHGNVAA